MHAGKLNHRVTIQQRSTTRDPAMGSEIVGWADVVTVWAQFDPIRGREYYSAKQEQAETVARFRIRYRSDIVTEMRVVFGGKFYDIEDVINVRGLNDYLELMTREGLTNG